LMTGKSPRVSKDIEIAPGLGLERSLPTAPRAPSNVVCFKGLGDGNRTVISGRSEMQHSNMNSIADKEPRREPERVCRGDDPVAPHRKLARGVGLLDRRPICQGRSRRFGCFATSRTRAVWAPFGRRSELQVRSSVSKVVTKSVTKLCPNMPICDRNIVTFSC